MGSRSRLSIAALTFALALASATAHAQEPTASASARATARALMDEGFDHRERGDLRGALEAFRGADALVHAPTAALEAARSEAALGMLVEARNHLEAIAGASPAPGEPHEFVEARDAAGQIADDLDTRIPSLRVAVEGDPKDTSSITIDGEAIPRGARFVAHRLNPGPHLIVARTADGREGRAQVTVREREARRILVSIPEAQVVAARAVPTPAPAPAPAAAALKPVPAPSRDHTLAYIGGGVGGVGLIVGSVAGLSAILHRSAAASKCTDNSCPPSSFHDLDAASSASSVANIGFVVAAVGTAALITDLFILPRAKTPAASTSVRPFIGAGAAGVHGTF